MAGRLGAADMRVTALTGVQVGGCCPVRPFGALFLQITTTACDSFSQRRKTAAAGISKAAAAADCANPIVSLNRVFTS